MTAGDSSNNLVMKAFSDPVIGQIPLYQVNEAPVSLTGSKESQAFFGGLTDDMKRQTDGSWVGYRYVFFRDAMIDTARHEDPKSREPLSIYLMKRVKPETGKGFELTPEDSQKYDEAIEEEFNNHDLFQEAMGLRKSKEPAPQIRKRKVERARWLLKILADKGLARAQYELAIMYRDGEGGGVDIKKAERYAERAFSQGLPVLSLERNTTQVVSGSAPAPQQLPAPLFNAQAVAQAPLRVAPVRTFDEIWNEYSFISLPEVTRVDVQALRTARFETGIEAPMPAIKAANALVSIGLYFSIMGHYPDLSFLSLAGRNTTLNRWRANPDLPLTYTTLAQDQEFVRKLNERTVTGRFVAVASTPTRGTRGPRFGARVMLPIVAAISASAWSRTFKLGTYTRPFGIVMNLSPLCFFKALKQFL